MAKPTLTSAQRAALRSAGRRRKPDMRIGKAGIDPAAVAHLARLLERAELVKVRLPAGAPAERAASADALADALDAARADLVGRVVVLYRPNDDLPPAERVELPKD